MLFRTLQIAALLSLPVACHRNRAPHDVATEMASPSPAIGSVEQRMAVARSVEVETAILGLQPGVDLSSAHQKLDDLGHFTTPPKDDKERKREGGNKTLWELRATDYRAVLIKTDNKERITSITAYFREDKMKPFDTIGDTKVAPVLTDNQVAWDIVRPDQPHFRVVASGKDRKAAMISVFIVTRPRSQALEPD